MPRYQEARIVTYSGGFGTAVEMIPPSMGGSRTTVQVLSPKYWRIQGHSQVYSPKSCRDSASTGLWPNPFLARTGGIQEDSGVLSEFFKIMASMPSPTECGGIQELFPRSTERL